MKTLYCLLIIATGCALSSATGAKCKYKFKTRSFVFQYGVIIYMFFDISEFNLITMYSNVFTSILLLRCCQDLTIFKSCLLIVFKSNIIENFCQWPLRRHNQNIVVQAISIRWFAKNRDKTI